jgi:hypothetical protein
MNNTISSHKWGISIFHFNFYSYGPWNLLFFTQNQTFSLDIWNHNHIGSNSYCIFWLCPTMRSNVLLGSNCNYKYFLCYSFFGQRINSMTMGKFFRFSTYSKPIFFFTFYCSNSYCSFNNYTLNCFA